MKPAALLTAFVLAVPVALPAPATAQTLSMLLPAISFPAPIFSPSTKGCTSDPAPKVCTLDE